MNLKQLLKEDNLLETFSVEELEKLGFDDSLIAKLGGDPHQIDYENGFLGALVLNFLFRENLLDGKLKNKYVHAYLLAEAIRMDLSDLMEMKDFDRPLVVERKISGESDLYIKVQDLHLVTGSSEDLTVEELIKDYYRTRNPSLAQEVTKLLEEDLKKITFHHCIRLRMPSNPESYLPEAYHALLDAFDKWDPDRGAAFRTYLFEGVRLRLLKAKDQQRRAGKTILYNPVNKDEDGILMNFKEDESSPNPLRNLLNQELTRIINQDIQDIPKKHRQVFYLYFFEGYTLKEVGKELGFTDSRADQIQKKYLRSEYHFKRTKEYLNIKKIIHLDLMSDLD